MESSLTALQLGNQIKKEINIEDPVRTSPGISAHTSKQVWLSTLAEHCMCRHQENGRASLRQPRNHLASVMHGSAPSLVSIIQEKPFPSLHKSDSLLWKLLVIKILPSHEEH